MKGAQGGLMKEKAMEPGAEIMTVHERRRMRRSDLERKTRKERRRLRLEGVR